MTEFDEKDYWKRRHLDHRGQLQSVGIDTVSELANRLVYQQLVDQYERVLDSLDLPAGTTALDAGAGVGAFTRLLYDRGFELTALDISQPALDGIDLPITKVCSPISTAGFAPGSFEYVHSFDVLYHIMDQAEWAASVAALATWSSRYVVLHERFMRFPQWQPSKIMKMRSRGQTAAILAENGFRESITMPTHFSAMQFLTYRVAGLAPRPFYAVDHWVLGKHADNRFVKAVSSHRIKVFERV